MSSFDPRRFLAALRAGLAPLSRGRLAEAGRAFRDGLAGARPPDELRLLREGAPLVFTPSALRRMEQAQAGGAFETRRYPSAAGRRACKLFIPSRPAPAGEARLIVMLHGCKQDVDDFARGTGMNELAEARGWHVLWPQQALVANPLRCWNWFLPAHQRAGDGEPAILAALTRAAMAERGIGAGRVAVAGLSAGGAMALVLAATHPDLFEAVGVHSGVAFGAAQDGSSALAAMRAGAPGAPVRLAPRLILFQGEGDETVHPANAEAILLQAGVAGEASARRETGAGDLAYTRMTVAGRDGRPRVEAFRVEGLGHAWSGGRPGGSYADPRGPDASAEMARFFAA